MELTEDVLEPFVGGQLEIRYVPSYLYRGEIKAIELGGGDLVVKLEWMAEALGDDICTPSRWVESDSADFRTVLSYYDASREGDNIVLRPRDDDDTIILYPRGGDALDRRTVKKTT